MKKISIDIESYSDIDLNKCGVYRYAESTNAELLLFGYAVDDGKVEVVDVAQGEKIPTEILKALSDDTVEKWCFNANFERVFLSRWLARNYPTHFYSYSINEDTVGDYLNPSAWKCSMVWSAYLGLPLSLESVGAALGLEKQKLTEGKDLIRYFCVPCKPTKVNGGRTRNLPEHDMEKWERFKAYNLRDVETEMQIQRKLVKFPVPEFVWEEYHLDQEINDRGIGVDMETEKKEIIANAEIIRRTLCATDSLREERQKLEDEMLVLVEMTKSIVAENARIAQDQDEYQNRYDGLVQRYETAKTRYDEVAAAISAKEAQSERLVDFIRMLKKQDGSIAEFDERLWGCMVDFVTVGRKKEITVTFRDGTEIQA